MPRPDLWPCSSGRRACSNCARAQQTAVARAAHGRRRGRRAPDDMGAVATLLERFGFANEAEEAYKAFVARNPKEPDRVLLMASFLARQSRTKEAVAILDKARATCRPDAVARTAQALVFLMLRLYIRRQRTPESRLKNGWPRRFARARPRPWHCGRGWPLFTSCKRDTARPRVSCARSWSTNPITSTPSTPSPGCWPSAKMASRREALEMIDSAASRKEASPALPSLTRPPARRPS